MPVNGNVILRFVKELLDINLQDMYLIRNVLEPMLRPGVGYVENAWNFRQRWELCPVKENDYRLFPNGSVVMKYNLENAPYVDKRFNCPGWNVKF